MQKMYVSGMLLLLLLCGCGTGKGKLYEAGVSKELAVWRKETVKDLKYELFFSIPGRKEEPVQGEVTVSFRLETPQEVLLDFRNVQESLHEVRVNGAAAGYAFKNEHIILPAEAMRAGENRVRMRFTAGDRSLNRNEEFLYTLLVPDRARTVFPCFDQPDLKAEYTLSLEIPGEWTAVSNTHAQGEEALPGGRRTVRFAPTEPLSTYLFSFVAGCLESETYEADGRRITAYHRETDPEKVEQLDTIFKQVAHSLRWMEEFTGVPYPFAKYDFIILPGFQYGGMEHTGATLYNDTRMFLGAHPTPDEELARAELIAHETAHMWFGDYVTMAWFDDVWTKEVFANYFAACICEPMFPDVDHSLVWLRNYTAAALSEDRTEGTNAIKQPLANLDNAGLLYGQIIYNKAPVMMKKLVELMGGEAFREGIREYLRTFAYGNATWEELVEILDRHAGADDLREFSRVWVHEKGMPHLSFTLASDCLEIRQRDPYHRGLVWRQAFGVRLIGERDTVVEVRIDDTLTRMPLPFGVKFVRPNVDGRGYGLLMPDNLSLMHLMLEWKDIPDTRERQALLMLLYENYLAVRISDTEWFNALFDMIGTETDPQIATTLASYIVEPLGAYNEALRPMVEQRLLQLAQTHPVLPCRTQLLRRLIAVHTSPGITGQLYALWQAQDCPLLGEQDYTALAYELTLRLPRQRGEILETQRGRIANPDRRRQFDFIARVVTPDTLQADSLFRSFLEAENRRIEPWTAAALRYLNHPLRDTHAVKYILPGLEALRDVQRTGDIFFPKDWASALLSGHRCGEACREVDRFLQEHPDYPPLLKNKILQAAYPLHRERRK